MLGAPDPYPGALTVQLLDACSLEVVVLTTPVMTCTQVVTYDWRAPDEDIWVS